MKNIIFMLVEDSKTAKSATVPITSNFIKIKTAYTLWERVNQSSFNLKSYMKSFQNEMVLKLMGLYKSPGLSIDGNYFRGIIISESNQFLIFTWNGNIPHEEFTISLSASQNQLNIPKYNYNTLYMNSMSGKFQTNWCFPYVSDDDNISTNLTKANLIKFEKEVDGKNKLKISDIQWKSMLDEAW